MWRTHAGAYRGCLELGIDLSISQAAGTSFACRVGDRLRQGGTCLRGVWGFRLSRRYFSAIPRIQDLHTGRFEISAVAGEAVRAHAVTLGSALPALAFRGSEITWVSSNNIN